MGQHADYTAEKRAEIVLALLQREEPASVLARRYKISDSTLYRWRDDFLAAGTTGLAASSLAKRSTENRIANLEKQVAERDQVIGELTIANRILKKTDHLSSTKNSRIP